MIGVVSAGDHQVEEAQVVAGNKESKTGQPTSSKMTPDDLVTSLRAALGDELHSVVLYGSAAAGDFVPGASDYDVLIIANRLDFETLRQLSHPILQWTANGNPSPQCFTLPELLASADAFPIEFLDLQQSRKVIFGSDPFSSLVIAQEPLRLQLERELKGKLLLLRQKCLLLLDRPNELRNLLIASATTFLVLSRAALRLFQAEAPRQKVAALRDLAGHLSLDIQPILTLVELRESGPVDRSGNSNIDNLFRNYLATLEKLVAAIDTHLHAPRPSGENL